MAEALDRIYDALLLDHIRAARNYGLDDGGPTALEIANPLCGDVLLLQLTTVDGAVENLRFSCECCGIAMGSASLMTESVQGRSLEGARALAEQALAVLAGRLLSEGGENGGDVWALLRAIGSDLPGRRTCASLGWQALLAVLDGQSACTAREIRE